MHAVKTLRTLLGTLAAIALGLLLAWTVFTGWIGTIGSPSTVRSPAAAERFTTERPLENSQNRAERPPADEAPVVSLDVAPSPNSVEPPIVLASAAVPSEDAAATSAETTADPSSPAASGDAQTLIRLLEVADHHFERGNYSECLQRFQFLLPNTQGAQRRLVAVKLGVVAESLSELDIAARAYSASLEMHHRDELSALARLRIATILASQGDLLGARSHLCDWWNAGGMQSRSEFEQSAVHLLAEIQARIACQASAVDRQVGMHSLQDDRVAWPFTHEPPLIDIEELQEAALAVVEFPMAESTRIEIIDQFSSSLEDTFASIQVVSRPLSGICDVLARKSGQAISWSEAGYRRASERTVTLALSDVNVAVLLDLMTRGAGLIWLQTDDGLVIAAETDLGAEDLAILDLAAARRLTQYAIATYPENKQQRLTQLAIANLDFYEGRMTDAAHRYAQLLDRRTERRWSTEAAFNLGKVRLLQGDLEGSAQAFLRSSDESLGHPLQSAALLYAGRLHVCLNRLDEALPLFSRAWTLSRGAELEAEALICLSSLYAYLGNPVGANRILVDHQDVVRDVAGYHDLAAFLGCYCRFSLARSDSRRLRDARDLLDALGNIDPHTFFSPHGWGLVLRAYHGLGLDQESRAILEECLVACEDSPFRDELVRAEAHGRSLQDGVARPRSTSEFEQLSAAVGDEILHRFERVKSLLGEGAHAELEQEAATLLAEDLPSSMQLELLDMLGRSYQRQGDHYNAALCFARINPFGDRADRLRGEFFRQRAREWGGTQP